MYTYCQQNNVSIRVARIFNTFGPRMHPNDGRVVSNFIIQGLQNDSITIYGSGEQKRVAQKKTNDRDWRMPKARVKRACDALLCVRRGGVVVRSLRNNRTGSNMREMMLLQL